VLDVSVIVAAIAEPDAVTPVANDAADAPRPLNAEPVGADVTVARTVVVSVASVVVAIGIVIVVFDTIPIRAALGVPAEIEAGVTPRFAADAGATEVRTPKPREATATSAMRLKVVFVDICFLSISRVREFPELGFG
jgi:hypothetical protein